MFDINVFKTAVEILNKNPLNDEQKKSVLYDCDKPLFVVAGPGTGKTTVLTYRILKFVFVDGKKPNTIIATTFTVKAANELRSRILEKGIEMIKLFRSLDSLTIEQEEYLNSIDFNQIKTGTLDSIAEEVLTEYRSLEELTPIIIDDIISKAYFLKSIFYTKAYKDKELKNYIKSKINSNYISVSSLRDYIQTIYEKIYHEDINLNDFIESIHDFNSRKLENKIKDIIENYIDSIWNSKNLYDFTRLEYRLYKKLIEDLLEEFINNYDILLVDEYQDTNYLQQQIYFSIIKKIRKKFSNSRDIDNFAPITVVGDDDQSLYRFRGSVVQLFRNFSEYFNQEFNIIPETKYLTTNYRSSKTIINFYNDFLKLDKNYLNYARVKEKDFVNNNGYSTPPEDFPILCLFRDDIKILARDLAQFMWDIYRGNGRKMKFDNKEYLIKASQSGGDIGDTILLMPSPREKGSFGGKYRFPFFLRHELEQCDIRVFNPRGVEVAMHNDFQILAGLILLCLDPDLRIQNSQKFFVEVISIFERWRKVAQNFNENYLDHGERNKKDLLYYINSWSRRHEALNEDWDIPLLDLVYELIYWIEDFIEEPEHQLYLELLTRTIAQSASYASYGARIVKQKYKPEEQDRDSIIQLFWNIFVPIASGEIFINEELIDEFPRDRLNIFSIHQSKGLEFPMIIVDVGSEFQRDHRAHRFKRFPDKGSITHLLEQEYRKFSAIKEFMEKREDPVERAFDDLIRRFYVAYSRAQEIIVLIGLNANLDNKIPNVALGWTRNREWKWENNYPWIFI